MSKPTYWELLKHPNWQRKRLELLKMSDFKCSFCDDGENTLHVHHTYYERGLKPWEYPDESLRVLCATCHEQEQDVMTELQRQVGKADFADVRRLLGFAKALESASFPMVPIVVASYEEAEGVGKWWGLSADQVIAIAQEGGVVDGYSLSAAANGGAKLEGL